MREQCSFLVSGVCRHPTIGPAIVQPIDCASCIAFNGRESQELDHLRLYREGLRTQTTIQSSCIHLGTKLSVAACCGQMYACNLFKGKKCAPTGIAKSPFLSCSACIGFESTKPIERKVRTSLTAVTSLNPNPIRKDRQRTCLQSWLNAGIEILAVNTSDELDSMPWLNGIAEQFVSNQTTTMYDKPVQKVSALIRAGMLTGGQFMLINSDIEIDGDVSILSDAIESQDRLTIGVRYNYDSSAGRQTSRLETAGLDVFVMTANMASNVQQREFGIGKPAWDYWLPHQMRLNGIKFNWIQRPLFFHESHPIGWSNAEWQIGHDMILRDYGISITQGDFRKQLQAW